MALSSNTAKIPSTRTWEVLSVFEPLPLSQAYCRVLKEMSEDPVAPGFSDVGIRNLLFTLILSLRPESVLELGSHIGTASVVIGEALRLNNFGKLFTVDPQDVYLERLRGYIARAGLENWIEPIKGFSHEPELRETLRNVAPFELIFVDACHDYQVVLPEIRHYVELLGDNGIMVFHDTSEHATSLDTKNEGGVRRALLEICQADARLQPIFFEYPLWLNNCGAAMLCKQKLQPRRGLLSRLAGALSNRS